MRRNCLILTYLAVGCVLLLQTGEAKAQAGTTPEANEPTTTPEANEPPPEIRFEKVIHDFGQVGTRSKHLCNFGFTNVGEGLLKITNVTKTCGCTPFTLDKKEYAPGESGILKVRYKAGKKPGTAKRNLFVFSNDPKHPNVKLTIKAKIIPKVVYTPEKLNLLLKKENAGCPQITLKSVDKRAFAITSFSATNNCITAETDRSKQSRSFILKPKVDIDKLSECLVGQINITLTHPKNKTITIPFNTLPDFEITPPAIIIFDTEPQKPIKKEVWVLSNYGDDFEVESASSKNGTINVLKQEKIGNRYKFEIEIIPPAIKDNAKFFKDTFSVNIKGGKKLTVNCRGLYSRKTAEPSN